MCIITSLFMNSLFPTCLSQEKEQWIEDIDFLKHELEIRHADLYHTVTKDSLNKLINDLKTDLHTYSDKEILFELGKALVYINDGHTGLFLPYNGELKLHRLPVYLRAVEGSIVVMNALPGFENLIGNKLMEIEGRRVGDLLEVLYDYIPRDNQYGPEGDGVTTWSLPNCWSM